jgi:hypothetical protein
MMMNFSLCSNFEISIEFKLEEWPKNKIHLWTMIERMAKEKKEKLQREQQKAELVVVHPQDIFWPPVKPVDNTEDIFDPTLWES